MGGAGFGRGAASLLCASRFPPRGAAHRPARRDQAAGLAMGLGSFGSTRSTRSNRSSRSNRSNRYSGREGEGTLLPLRGRAHALGLLAMIKILFTGMTKTRSLEEISQNFW